MDVYGQPTGALAFPRKVFLTRSVDPQGQRVQLTYDASLRLVAITDAIGQVTTLSYELAGDPLKITRVTDPFGRYADIRVRRRRPAVPDHGRHRDPVLFRVRAGRLHQVADDTLRHDDVPDGRGGPAALARGDRPAGRHGAARVRQRRR